MDDVGTGLHVADAAASAVRTLNETISQPFADACGMPANVYTSPDVAALEQQRVFRREWICVGRTDAIPESGAYLTYEIGGQPIFVIRDQAGAIRAFSNVCLHRMALLLEGRGRTSAIICPYHAWTYGLDGSLRGAPHMERTAGFHKENYCLPELRTDTWLGWIYVTLNPDVAPVAQRLSKLTELIQQYHMENYVETFRDELVWNTNWKLLAENFMESYHLPTLHRATIGPASPIGEMECPPGFDTFNYHWLTKDASLPIGNAHPSNTTLQGDWRRTVALLAIYPTQLISLTPGYFWYLLLSPRGVGQVHIVFGGGLAPEFIHDPQASEHMQTLKTLLDRVNEEDRHGVEMVFRNAHAPLAKPGHFSWLERPNYDFAQYLARQLSSG
jgi:choline monooxygenase